MKNIAILFSILILIALAINFFLKMKKKDDGFSNKISNQEFIDKSLTDKKIEGFRSYDWTIKWMVVGIILIIMIISFLFKLIN